ncbi:hypothetical protein EON65_43330 [archaeon]|nr:MAG: hypothetical protein EON65_43330 [archaeon]
MGLALNVHYRAVKTRHDYTALLEITFAEDNEVVSFNLWGQLAEDRVKFGLKEGGVCVIANGSLTQDKFGRPVLQGDLVAYTHINNGSQLDWLLPSLQSIASHVGNFQDKCNQLIELASQKPDLKTLRYILFLIKHADIIRPN